MLFKKQALYLSYKNPPPLHILGRYGTREAQLILVIKREKLNSPKTPKMAIININQLGKAPKVPKTLYFHF